MSQSIDDRTGHLIKQYITNKCTYEEYQELLALLKIQTDDTQLEGLLMEELLNSQSHAAESEVDWETMLQTITQQHESIPIRRVRSFIWIKRFAIAAVFILLVGIIVWWWLQKQDSGNKQNENVPVIADISPGRSGAILTLQNGRHVVLDSAHNGTLVAIQGLHIDKHDSSIAYAPAPKLGEVSNEMSYNTLSTPRGRQFQLVLADGTKVWLNAASSIRYPTLFSGKERVVDITGEVYFEVAKNTARPFIVNILSEGEGSQKGRVEVLGTHFNINAYDDEKQVRTTLLEGKVKASIVNGEFAVLHPGDQAVMDAGTPLTINHAPDVESVMAWKNGYFHFKRADIKTVMRQIARWYDVEIQYEGAITTDQFGGYIPRDATLSQVLHALEQSLVHFSIQGKKVIVTP